MAQSLTDREGEVFILSDRVGPFIDIGENNYYGIFAKEGFLGGQFFYYSPDDKLMLSVTQYKTDGKVIIQKSLVPKTKLFILKATIEAMPEISDSLKILYSHTEREEYFRYVSSFLKMGNLCRIKLTNGDIYEGNFYKTRNKSFLISREKNIISIPYDKIETVYYWWDYEFFPWAYKGAYLMTAFSGLIVFDLTAKLLKVDSDLLWYYRFSGAAAGLMAGYWLDDYVNEFFNPPEVYAVKETKGKYINSMRFFLRNSVIFIQDRFFHNPVQESEK